MSLRNTHHSKALPVLLLAAVVALGGCSSLRGGAKQRAAKEAEGKPVATIYDQAHRDLTTGNYGTAEESYKRLLAQYPFGPYAEQAMMEMAYTQYKANNNDDAISTIDRFLRTYPTNRNIPYMYYLRGLANQARHTVFLQRVFDLDMSQRDLAAPTQAYNDFGLIVERYPNSRYAPDARQRMLYLRDEAARFELGTAIFYLQRDAWVAAANRAKYLLETYPQSAYQNDAVAVLAESYKRLGQTTLSEDAKRVLQANEPTHPWFKGGWPRSTSVIRKLNPFARGGEVAVPRR